MQPLLKPNKNFTLNIFINVFKLLFLFIFMFFIYYLKFNFKPNLPFRRSREKERTNVGSTIKWRT